MLTTGTKSVLFGVHCIFWHPITVARAWRDLYGRWPRGLAEWLAVIFHDIGYWGSADIDGAEGRRHPARSVEFLCKVLPRWTNRWSLHTGTFLIHGHSRHYAVSEGRPLSRLYAADKLSLFYDPPWFYLLRARLSGEIWEYMANTGCEWSSPEEWLYWYREKVRKEFNLE